MATFCCGLAMLHTFCHDIRYKCKSPLANAMAIKSILGFWKILAAMSSALHAVTLSQQTPAIYPEHLAEFLGDVFLVDLLEKAATRSARRAHAAAVVGCKAVLVHFDFSLCYDDDADSPAGYLIRTVPNDIEIAREEIEKSNPPRSN